MNFLFSLSHYLLCHFFLALSNLCFQISSSFYLLLLLIWKLFSRTCCIANIMGDYRNSAQPPTGVNFQPPVPDTTFGTMSHVYVPRFDGGGLQVGVPYSPMLIQQQQMQMAPSLPIQMAIPVVTGPTPTCTTILVPKTFYTNGYPYYAS